MASFFGDDFKYKVINANDIVDLVSEYVTLKKTGRNLLGLCPFHNEKTPSFSVSADKQFFHCFGCGAGGNALDFVMRTQRLDFVEAVKYLADRANIPVIEDNSAPREQGKKEKCYNMNRLAAKFFNDNLSAEAGRRAYDYLMKRGVSPSTVTKFGLGFAPDSYNALTDLLKKEGYSPDQAYDAGLVNKKDGKIFDTFRNRVMFPIIDLRGNVVAFGGRAMGDDTKYKYINTSGTPVFTKSENFYGLNFAKSYGKSTLIIVEGYMDVIALHQAGITNAVAALGTAFTQEHAKALKRYTDCAVIAFDSDEPGRLAAMRCIDILSETDIKIKVLSQDKAKDPDEFIKAYGRNAFLELIENAPGHIEYKINELKKKCDFSAIEDKVRFVTEAAGVLLTIKSDVELEMYVKKVSGEAGVSPEALYSELKKRSAASHTVKKRVFPEQTRQFKPDTATPLHKSERMLLSLLYDDVNLINKCGGIIEKDYFSDPVHGEVFEIMRGGAEAGKILDTLTPEQRGVITEIALTEHHLDDKYHAVNDVMRNINIQKQRLNIEKSAGDAEALAEALKNSSMYKG